MHFFLFLKLFAVCSFRILLFHFYVIFFYAISVHREEGCLQTPKISCTFHAGRWWHSAFQGSTLGSLVRVEGQPSLNSRVISGILQAKILAKEIAMSIKKRPRLGLKFKHSSWARPINHFNCQLSIKMWPSGNQSGNLCDQCIHS